MIVFLSLVLPSAFEYRQSGAFHLFPFLQAVTYQEIPGGENPSEVPSVTYIAAGGEYRPLMPDLRGESITAGGPAGEYIAWQAGYRHYGIDEYCEHSVSASACGRFGRWASLGVGVLGYHVAIKGESFRAVEKAADMSAGLLVNPFSWLTIGAVGQNIVSGIDRKRQSLLYPEYSVGCSVSPFDGLYLAYNRTQTAGGPLNTMGIHAAFLGYCAVSMGYTADSSESSVCLHLLYRRMLVSYRFRYHPALGTSHGIGISLSLESRSFTSLRYGTMHAEPVEKKDIALEDDDGIRKIPCLTEEEAEKLIRYRREVGPLTVEALYGIGLERERVAWFLDSFYGFRDERDRQGGMEKKKREHRPAMRDRQRAAFRQLVELGIGPSMALEFVEIATLSGGDELDVRLRAAGNLSEEQRKAAYRICADLGR